MFPEPSLVSIIGPIAWFGAMLALLTVGTFISGLARPLRGSAEKAYAEMRRHL